MMRISTKEQIVRLPTTPARMWLGWTVVAGLVLLELLAVLYGRPSTLSPGSGVGVFIATVGQHVPTVNAFARCAATLDSGSGLMLALIACFFPVKLAALFYAHPVRLQRMGESRDATANIYALFIGFMAFMPMVVYFIVLRPGDVGLPSLNRKAAAVCVGGLPAFYTAMLQSTFALAGVYISLVMFAGVLRDFWGRLSNRK